MTWETVIGLEIHVQPSTRSKMFCGCPTSYGDAPNTNVCPVCLGLPGALPVPNAEAVRLGTVGALALGCAIRERSIFARKNYFYPDLPKGYQISQFDKPLAEHGSVMIESPERGSIAISITRLHLEEDAGKSLHDRIPGQTAVDLNRAGTPLAEIVSGPDMRSPGEARAYLTTVRQLLIYAGVSECSMEKGSLRVDANLSVRRPGDPLGTKTEVKNMNSFANVERALEAERIRQIAMLERGEAVTQVTLTFNAATGEVKPLRSKEDSHDYRYFPDPDLPPLVLTPAWIEAQRVALPELPAARKARYQEVLGLSEYDARTLIQEPQVSAYFEGTVAAGVDPKTASNWVLGEAMSGWNEQGHFAIAPERLASLVLLVADGTVSLQAAKRIFAELVGNDDAPRAVADRLGLVQVRDTGALEGWVAEVIAAHPGEVARYKGGDAKLIGFFVGQVMKRSQGKADPKGIQPILTAKLAE
ncbi:MAG: Asp-tRNA(Asn)/Glu-tRNA(Gln) amidotransferase subunit GatB [Gemmatimonadetes bacterium]|jgi:aspartyl-tRNA(Asn)/glutamyl-tRNA(Gln) amidotransferase subunit B|nr:Asp-tRNA(Asn)/Glu-tRNA(Gln) amidotransferase subunit GatB [Gemmatimonadota bacterium]MBP6572394.1 Asp-tRNA(Asn)/Glu-tRNA(Gln) amidotransferase subunit GatB [Gemmatimonadales bacterium]MBP9897648.1 Asp-tRNA(Asn)/Glu-tRNA(Gln) amidotransferase subunit GatB [Gemmatimonadales bacterium]